jgi:hypothetical protein
LPRTAPDIVAWWRGGFASLVFANPFALAFGVVQYLTTGVTRLSSPPSSSSGAARRLSSCFLSSITRAHRRRRGLSAMVLALNAGGYASQAVRAGGARSRREGSRPGSRPATADNPPLGRRVAGPAQPLLMRPPCHLPGVRELVFLGLRAWRKHDCLNDGGIRVTFGILARNEAPIFSVAGLLTLYRLLCHGGFFLPTIGAVPPPARRWLGGG